MNRINKEELIELIESLKIDKNEFWILSTSHLVLKGLFPDSGDLDIAVTEEGLRQLKEKFNLKQKENGWYIVNDKIECILDTKDEAKIEQYGPYLVEKLSIYYKFLKEAKREKDKVKIKIIEEELKRTKSL